MIPEIAEGRRANKIFCLLRVEGQESLGQNNNDRKTPQSSSLPYHQIPFLQFQLFKVNCRLEADDPASGISEGQLQPNAPPRY